MPIKEHQIVDHFFPPTAGKLKDEVMTIKPVQKQSSAGQRTYGSRRPNSPKKRYAHLLSLSGASRPTLRSGISTDILVSARNAPRRSLRPSAVLSSWRRCTSSRSAAATGGPSQRQKHRLEPPWHRAGTVSHRRDAIDAPVAWRESPRAEKECTLLTYRFYTVKTVACLTRSP